MSNFFIYQYSATSGSIIYNGWCEALYAWTILFYFYCLIKHQTLLIVTQDKKFNNGMLSKTKCYRDPPWHPLLSLSWVCLRHKSFIQVHDAKIKGLKAQAQRIAYKSPTGETGERGCIVAVCQLFCPLFIFQTFYDLVN